MKPCNSAACVALRRVAALRPPGCAGAASAIMTLRPRRKNRSADRIRKLPVELMMVPVASRLSKPSPPVIKTTLARAARGPIETHGRRPDGERRIDSHCLGVGGTGIRRGATDGKCQGRTNDEGRFL